MITSRDVETAGHKTGNFPRCSLPRRTGEGRRCPLDFKQVSLVNTVSDYDAMKNIWISKGMVMDLLWSDIYLLHKHFRYRRFVSGNYLEKFEMVNWQQLFEFSSKRCEIDVRWRRNLRSCHTVIHACFVFFNLTAVEFHEYYVLTDIM